ncbi:hypothetical protein M3C58_08100 [Brachybacterium muris]|uniref:Uncharacterized protein n=2 Tax=Brachybacterium TaxID=43668 RepID=A0A022KZZ5_9MICO|nr:hypothetical protein [Brachybacterium muris]EYT48983.1 hypothetical protein D641_0110135 [Brachybacterium muris UCD-AY4]MCT1429424.1 hypothetical protein [Brachybacterium muris]MCT1998155.1 hypothetical protein [Brachybacterium muris]MCT2176391.1 hypothetical protein [Brachybacterium muris]
MDGDAGRTYRALMGATSTLDHSPRLTELPGASRLLRIDESTFAWVIAQVRDGSAPSSETAAAQAHQAGLLQSADPVEVEPHWDALLRRAITSPVRIDMVSVDGARAWATTVHVAGEIQLVIDQVREVTSSDSTVSLGARSSALTLAVGRIEHFSDLITALVPQRPAFGADPSESLTAPEAPGATTDPPSVDPPSVAQVQVVVSANPATGEPMIRDRSWYAFGADGTVLATLTGTGEATTAEPAPVGALTEILKADLIAAINHVTADRADSADNAEGAGQTTEGDER